MSATHGEALEVSSAMRDIVMALEAIDHSQWELDKMKREMQKLVRDPKNRIFAYD